MTSMYVETYKNTVNITKLGMDSSYIWVYSQIKSWCTGSRRDLYLLGVL